MSNEEYINYLKICDKIEGIKKEKALINCDINLYEYCNKILKKFGEKNLNNIGCILDNLLTILDCNKQDDIVNMIEDYDKILDKYLSVFRNASLKVMSRAYDFDGGYLPFFDRAKAFKIICLEYNKIIKRVYYKGTEHNIKVYHDNNCCYFEIDDIQTDIGIILIKGNNTKEIGIENFNDFLRKIKDILIKDDYDLLIIPDTSLYFNELDLSLFGDNNDIMLKARRITRSLWCYTKEDTEKLSYIKNSAINITKLMNTCSHLIDLDCDIELSFYNLVIKTLEQVRENKRQEIIDEILEIIEFKSKNLEYVGFDVGIATLVNEFSNKDIDIKTLIRRLKEELMKNISFIKCYDNNGKNTNYYIEHSGDVGVRQSGSYVINIGEVAILDKNRMLKLYDKSDKELKDILRYGAYMVLIDLTKRYSMEF